MTEIKLHGVLGQQVGDKWRLKVKSVGEAMHAIEIMSRHKLYKYLYENDKKGIRYKVLINGRLFKKPDKSFEKNIKNIKNSELCINRNSLKKIDVIPVIEGADSDILSIIAGAALIAVGVIFLATGFLAPLGAPLILGGIGLVAAGVINLLSQPPTFDEFRDFKESRFSYLFDGPTNTTRVGNPVPVVYGELITGSQVISATFNLTSTVEEAISPELFGESDSLELWLEADLGFDSIENGDTLNSSRRWNDQSKNAAQVWSNGTPPVWIESVFGNQNKPAILFDSSTNSFGIAWGFSGGIGRLISTKAVTIVALIRITNTGITNVITGGSDSGGTSWVKRGVAIEFRDAFGRQANSLRTINHPFSQANEELIIVRSGPKTTHWVNKTDYSPSEDVSRSGAKPAWIGTDGVGGKFEGYIAGVWMWSSRLTDVEIRSFYENYLTVKYGL